MSANTSLDPINRILKLLRVADELSASELGEQVGLSKGYICDIETGRKKPTLTVLEKYGQHFGISPANLLLLQEGNEHASNTELLFKVLEKRMLALAAKEPMTETEDTRDAGDLPKATSLVKKQPKQKNAAQRGKLAASIAASL